MTINEINQQQPVKAPMSNKERIIRTVAWGSAPIYDIGKALSEGKTVKEAVKEAGNKMEETQDANRKAFKENLKKTTDSPVYLVCFPVLNVLAKTLFKSSDKK
jgi:hypothetical protein